MADEDPSQHHHHHRLLSLGPYDEDFPIQTPKVAVEDEDDDVGDGQVQDHPPPPPPPDGPECLQNESGQPKEEEEEIPAEVQSVPPTPPPQSGIGTAPGQVRVPISEQFICRICSSA